MDITDAQIEAFAFSYWPVSAVTMLEKEREHLRISLAAALSQAEPAALAGQDGAAGLIKTAICVAMGWSPSEDGPSYASTLAKVERLISEALAALSRAPAGVQVKALTELLREIRDNGLIYWVPTTDKGLERRNDMIARIDDFLAAPPAAGVQAVPSGWVAVPREPLPEMIGAWYRVKNGHHFHDEPPPTDTSDYAAYRALIAAAPASPVGEEREPQTWGEWERAQQDAERKK